MTWPSHADIISGRATGWLSVLLRFGLLVLSVLHACGSRIFHRAFDLGLRRPVRTDILVISVGNLTAGGTGKTPFVALLANWLGQHGCAPCLVSRGYRASESGENDEKLVLDLYCPDVPHIQSADRVAACRDALSQFAADVVVLDDGFQHRRLHRDLDVVLVDCLNPWGFGYQLPRGLLRESPAAIRRADLIVLTRVDQVNSNDRLLIEQEVRRLSPATPVIHVSYAATGWRNAAGQSLDLDRLQTESPLAFCGLGNPRAFVETLSRCGFAPEQTMTFADHYHYDQDSLARIARTASQAQCDVLLTTVKDLVKIPHVELEGIPLWALEIRAEIVSGLETLEDSLRDVLARCGLSLRRRGAGDEHQQLQAQEDDQRSDPEDPQQP